MKLMIEIPEDTVKEIKDNAMFAESIASQIKWDVTGAIVNGIPIPDNATNVLDAIKLEIKQEYDNQGDWSFNDGLAFALEIIDKYQKRGKE